MVRSMTNLLRKEKARLVIEVIDIHLVSNLK
jgi:hypothetical protein